MAPTHAARPVRVLGVDPGLTRCGLGVVEGAPGRALSMVAVGVARTPADDDVGARLLALEEQIEIWLTAHQPDAVAVERVFSQRNVRTVMGTAQAGAVAIVCAARRGLPVALHTPSEVKAAISGNGRADKDQVTAMVVRLLRLTEPPRPADAADALALAICHLWRGGARSRLEAAVGERGTRAAGNESPEAAVISHLRGTVSGVAPDGAVIEVGGVGLSVQCTPGTLATLRPGEPARVATCLVVREDSLTLYGFTSDDERNVFELVQTATGVGPRLALAMLAVHTPDALRRAVSTGDLNALTLVPGIGKKGAQRIVLELKDRLGAPGDVPPDGYAGAAGSGLPGGMRTVPALPSWREQAQSGLVNLGWPARDAEQAVNAVAADLAAVDGTVPETADVAAVLRAAMKKLSRQ